MAEQKTIGIAKFECGTGNTMEITFPKVVEAPAHMNIGVALMPFMKEGYYFLKEDQQHKTAEEGLNAVETDFVTYLYKLRKANRDGTLVERSYFGDPKGARLRHRVFIAGTIFPILSIRYHGDAIDCSTVKIKTAVISQDKIDTMYSGAYKDEGVATRYITIDDKIDIFVPKSSIMDIDYLGLLVDFLTNGPKTQTVTTHGEFPDLDTYTLATDQTTLQPGCWLTEDREANNSTWAAACMYIVKEKLQGILAPFGQIADFYTFLDNKITNETKHKTRWLKGAKKLVNSLRVLDGIAGAGISNDVEIILNELNVGICDYAITQFYELFYGNYKSVPLDTLQKAYEWDLAFVQHEQGVVAVPIYAKASKLTIKKYQDMADQDGIDIGKGNYSSWHGLVGLVTDATISKTVPEFDDPWEGKVTDSQFRTDLPMLMLWLDRYKPTGANFKDKVNTDGYLLEEYKEIIEKYEAK